MRRKKRAPAVAETATEQAMRDQEVLRAARELAAYFRGRRTEREARAALKIIKAFVRDRERQDAKSRGPLPGRAAAKTTPERASRKSGGGGATRKSKPRRLPSARPATSAIAASPEAGSQPDATSDSD